MSGEGYSHHNANTAITLLIAAVAAEARLLDGALDWLLDGRAGAGGGQDGVDGGGDLSGGGHVAASSFSYLFLEFGDWWLMVVGREFVWLVGLAFFSYLIYRGCFALVSLPREIGCGVERFNREISR